MGEELVPPDFILSPRLFEATFINRENYPRLRRMAVVGKLGSLHNRVLSWRILLGILPEKGSLQDWIQTTRNLREQYRQLKESQTVSSTQKVTTEDLDPTVFNPLSPVSDVRPKLEPLEQLLRRQRTQRNHYEGRRADFPRTPFVSVRRGPKDDD